ncbi:queuosine salvage protein [Galendromus occidentalis]|uniref:Queuosine 5'-phosphate N-glycosylase/hydrolase n=1 Tax=Galendromus occidentalis TaxID=34638 RepID=A0AAJ6QMV6_9ACAR|nr:queuosine salvage protein [Galendromus occidentalis]
MNTEDNDMGTLGPRASAEFIMTKAKDVRIDLDAARKLARHIHEATASNPYDLKAWKEAGLHPKEMSDATVEWIFVVDLLNFSFWSPTYQVEYEGQMHTGYWALCACLNRALKDAVPITSATFYASVSREKLKEVFRGHNDSEIPLFDERLNILHQAGRKLLEQYGGKFSNCLLQCGNDVDKLLRLVTAEFPSFRDQAVFEGRQVSFYKRAQILVADLWACFEGKSYGEFHNIDNVTCFADYRVPQILAHFGVIIYSETLRKLLDSGALLQNEQREVCEIRGATISACEKIRDVLQSEFRSPMNAILVDFYLWGYRRAHAKEVDATTPYHRVRCIYY